MTLSDLNPTWAIAKRVGVVLGVLLLAAIVFGIVFFGLTRLWPRHDQTPVTVARHDEKAAAKVATAIGDQVETANHDATIHLDLTQKDIRDAFDTLPPAQPAPQAGAPQPAPLPAAPVDRLRDRLNESIARANRAADPAGSTD